MRGQRGRLVDDAGDEIGETHHAALRRVERTGGIRSSVSHPSAAASAVNDRGEALRRPRSIADRTLAQIPAVLASCAPVIPFATRRRLTLAGSWSSRRGSAVTVMRSTLRRVWGSTQVCAVYYCAVLRAERDRVRPALRASQLSLKLVYVPQMTTLGELLEQARADLRISAREAARRAGISETRWRQIVSGSQVRRGRDVPVNPKARTVVAVALAVLVDPAEALAAAGLAVPADLALLVRDVQSTMRTEQRSTRGAGPVVDLTASEHTRLNTEIARIEGMRLPESAKLTMLEALIRAWERYAIERDADSASA